MQAGTSEQEPPENKYLVKPATELRSRFVTQQEEEKKKREAEAASLEEQQEVRGGFYCETQFTWRTKSKTLIQGVSQ